MNNTLILFTKSPVICRVKTRLWPTLSHRECLYLHKKLIHNIISEQRHHSDINIKIYSTEIKHKFFNNKQTYKQVGKDLGMRMNNAIMHELKYTEKVLLIGSDCVEFTQDYIKHAFEVLKNKNDIVIAPSNDGGYALIGMRKPHPTLFNNIPWSTTKVLSRTLDIIQKENKKLTLLPEVTDIDEYSDLVRLHQSNLLPSWASSVIK